MENVKKDSLGRTIVKTVSSIGTWEIMSNACKFFVPPSVHLPMKVCTSVASFFIAESTVENVCNQVDKTFDDLADLLIAWSEMTKDENNGED